MNKLFGLGILLSLLALSGCAPVKTFTWYQARSFPVKDTACLRGKVIVLDPGHGGKYPGAKGKGGTPEKEVNLKVAVMLKELLEKGGARVYLTRDTDRDFLDNPKDHLRVDLKNRLAVVDSVDPDLFVSMHHNASKEEDDTENVIKTFYKMGDTGPSLDVAIKVHRYMVSYLHIDENELSMGNYFVLWNVNVPAILGEPSHLTHPGMEKILNNPEALYVEAQAYYQGIVEWFAGGIPKITTLEYDSAKNSVLAYIQSDFPLDTAMTEITIDGKRLNGNLEAGRYCASAGGRMISNGPHIIQARTANINGNASMVNEKSIFINREPALMNVICRRDAGPEGQYIPIDIVINDAYGLPVSDGTPVSTSIGQKGVTRNGQAVFYPVYKAGQKIRIECKNLQADLSINVDKSIHGLIQGFVKCGNKPVPAVVTPGEPVSCDINGFFEYPESLGTWVTVACDGYRDSTLDLEKGKLNVVELNMVENGILHEKRIILDPEFGGEETGGIGLDGVRASDINRKITERLAGRLKKAGASVEITRPGDKSVFNSERIDMARNPLAELYVVIRSDSIEGNPYVANYPNSRYGGIFSKYLSENALPDFNVEVNETVTYVMQQTPCTAVTVSLIPLTSKEPLEPARINRVSQILYSSIVHFFMELGKETDTL